MLTPTSRTGRGERRTEPDSDKASTRRGLIDPDEDNQCCKHVHARLSCTLQCLPVGSNESAFWGRKQKDMNEKGDEAKAADWCSSDEGRTRRRSGR